MSMNPSKLHLEAVFGPSLTDAERRQLCIEAASLYPDPFDQARATRDASKFGHRLHQGGEPTDWESEMVNSAHIIAAIDPSEHHTSEELQRELGATLMMHGRMLLADAIEEESSADLDNARALLNSGMSILPTDESHPDQYQVNFAALQMIANRFGGVRPSVSELRELWAMSVHSESPERIRHTADLTLSGRLKARGRAGVRALVATTLTVMPGQSPQPKRLARKIVQTSRVAA